VPHTTQAEFSKDINGRPDIYEWRNGALRLITNGVREFAPVGLAGSPKVYNVTPDGGSILYSAAEPGLTGFERSELANMYVARIGGGFPRPTEPVHCSEESCQGPLQAAPPESRPGSAAVQGDGNADSTPPRRKCRAGKVRRHGHCVPKKKKKAHHRHGAKHHNGGRGK